MASPTLVTLGVVAMGLATTGAVIVPGTATPGTPDPGQAAVSLRSKDAPQQRVVTPLSRSSTRPDLTIATDTAPTPTTPGDLRQVDRRSLRKTARAANRRSTALNDLEQRARDMDQSIRDNTWVMPVDSYRLTARFGQSSYLWSTVHTGLDFAAPTGTRIGAVAAGTVTSASYDGSYGNRVVVTHTDGTETWYAHMNTITVSEGQTLAAGDQVGTVGSTGNVTGPHLHLEVRPGGGGPVDPAIALAEHGLHV